jgi:hypothetical protein
MSTSLTTQTADIRLTPRYLATPGRTDVPELEDYDPPMLLGATTTGTTEPKPTNVTVETTTTTPPVRARGYTAPLSQFELVTFVVPIPHI